MPTSFDTFSAVSLETSRLSYRSILLPTSSRSILETSVFSLTSFIQKLIISKDFLLEISNTNRMPSTLRQQLGVIVLYRIVPAVSQIWTLIETPSSSLIVFCLYYTPIVAMWLRLNSSSTYCVSSELFPTQLYPIMSSLTLISYFAPLITSLQYNISHAFYLSEQSRQFLQFIDLQVELIYKLTMFEQKQKKPKMIIQFRCYFQKYLFMFRSLRVFFRHSVIKKSNGPQGKPLPNMEQFYLQGADHSPLSFWNDIPYNLKGDTLTACIEVPKQISNKFEVIKEQKHHPIMQDTKKNVFTKELQLRYYAQFPLFNYGFIPQTWQQNLVKDELGLFGDDDPIDICDLSTRKMQIGEAYEAKVLGCFCLIDQGEVDWKVIIIDAKQAKNQGINDLSHYPKQQIEAIKQWFKTIKVFDGKKANQIAYNQKIFSKDETLKIVNDTHLEWQKLISSPDRVYQQIRQKFHMTDLKVRWQ